MPLTEWSNANVVDCSKEENLFRIKLSGETQSLLEYLEIKRKFCLYERNGTIGMLNKDYQYNKPIRVAQIMGKLWAGGVETVVFNYYREMDKSKVQFDFFYDSDSTVQPPLDLINMGARFYVIPPYQNMTQYIKVLRKYFKQNQYVIVHSHLNTLSLFPLYAAWKEGVPVRIAHNHSVPGGKEWKRNLLKNVLRQFSKTFATDYFACSEKAGRWLFGNKLYEMGEVKIIRNAVDFGKFDYAKEMANHYREQFELQDKYVVGHVGRFTYAKNHKFLLEVFAEIKKKKKNAVLVLVGDGELRNEIEKWVDDLDLLESVIFVGKVSNPEMYYALFDVLILPSLFEGLSLATVEAQLTGVPAIISGAIPNEAVISNACKYITDCSSPMKWAEEAILMSGKKVVLNDLSNEYKIQNASLKLQKWYENKVKVLWVK